MGFARVVGENVPMLPAGGTGEVPSICGPGATAAPSIIAQNIRWRLSCSMKGKRQAQNAVQAENYQGLDAEAIHAVPMRRLSETLLQNPDTASRACSFLKLRCPELLNVATPELPRIMLLSAHYKAIGLTKHIYIHILQRLFPESDTHPA